MKDLIPSSTLYTKVHIFHYIPFLFPVDGRKRKITK